MAPARPRVSSWARQASTCARVTARNTSAPVNLTYPQKSPSHFDTRGWQAPQINLQVLGPLLEALGPTLTIRDRQTVMFITNSNDKSGELLGQERRRRWSPEQKLAMVRETLEPGKTFRWWPGATVSMPTSCSCGASCIRKGGLSAGSAGEAVVPPSELSDALKQICELQRMLGKKTKEAESSKRPWRSPGRGNGLHTHPCCWGTTGEAGQRMSRSDSTAAKVAREGTRCSVSLLALVANPRCV